MKNIVNEYIRLFKDNRRARRKTLGFISILALLVAVGVFWNLHFTGIALTGEVYYCGKEEHQHDEECYTWVLMSDEEYDESAMTAADEDEDETNSTELEEETVQNSETGTEEETIYISETESAEEATQISGTEAAAEEATQNFETEATEETVQGSAEEIEEETIQISETDSEKEASQSLETEEETDTSDNSISSGSNSEAASDTSIEEGTEPETSEGNDASDNETDALPAMILLSEATETEERYLNHGYEKVLICDKEEHTHTAKCLINENADVETAEDWEATLPENLNGTAAENLVAVALSQLGYSESEQNFSLSEDGETKNGYTRYGAWYGNAYGEWDAMFVAFCLHYAGISEEDFPVNSGAYAWAVQLAEADLYAAADEYTPSAGDLIFLDTDEDGKADLVGIVEIVTENAEKNIDGEDVPSGETTAEDSGTEVSSESLATQSDAETSSAIAASESETDASAAMVYTLTVIFGDYCDSSDSDKEETIADAVCRVEYASDDSTILGYGLLPDMEVDPPVSIVLKEQTLTVTVDDLTVTLSGQLPVDATVSAESVDLELEGQEVQFALEIAIYDADGNEFEPEDDTITVTVESESITDGCTIYYVPDEGDPEEISSESEDGTVSFDAEHFSIYAATIALEEEASLYETYMAKIAEYEEQAYALDEGDNASALELTSDLGDLLDTTYEDYKEGNLTEEEYTKIKDAINALWDWLEAKFDLYGISVTGYENGILRESFSGGTGNTWYDLSDTTYAGFDSISSNGMLSQLKLNYSNATCTGRLVKTTTTDNTYYNVKNFNGKNTSSYITNTYGVILLDVSDMLGTSSSNVRSKLSSGFSVTKDKSGNSNVGTITFSNAGTVFGRAVDVVITVNEVSFSNSYYSKWYSRYGENGTTGKGSYVGDSGDNISAPTVKNYIQIGAFSNLTNGTLQIGDSCLDSGDITLGSATSYWLWSWEFEYGWGVPLSTTVTYTVEIKYSNSSEKVDTSFLMRAYDIDIYRNGSDENSASYHSYGGYGSETFETLSGFDGNFYWYKAYNMNYITSSGFGKVKVQATDDTQGYYTHYIKNKESRSGKTILSQSGTGTGLSGNNSYKVGGVYAETSSGTWKVSQTVCRCGTTVEIYAPGATLQIKKVDSNNSSIGLPDVTFKLYKMESGTPNYYVYSNGVVTWTEDETKATTITTGGSGTVSIRGLGKGTYYLTEITSADGYIILEEDIQFQMDAFGLTTIWDESNGKYMSESTYASVGYSTSTITLTIKNDASYALPDTGGGGTFIYTSTGLILFISAAWLMNRQKRRRRERAAGG